MKRGPQVTIVRISLGAMNVLWEANEISEFKTAHKE